MSYGTALSGSLREPVKVASTLADRSSLQSSLRSLTLHAGGPDVARGILPERCFHNSAISQSQDDAMKVSTILSKQNLAILEKICFDSYAQSRSQTGVSSM